MSYDEMIDEFEKIYQNVKATSMNNIQEARYRSYLIKNKHKTNVFFKPRHIKIDEISSLYVIPFAHSWSIYKKIGLRFVSFLTYLTDNGLCMMRRTVTKDTGEYDYSFYTSHFFDRYRERELEGADLEKPQVIYHYVAHNPFEYRDCDNYHYKNEEAAFLATCNTGLACGILVEKAFPLYKTYISRNDLSRNKTEIMKDLDNLHNEEMEDLREFKAAILNDPDWIKDCRDNSYAAVTLVAQ